MGRRREGEGRRRRERESLPPNNSDPGHTVLTWLEGGVSTITLHLCFFLEGKNFFSLKPIHKDSQKFFSYIVDIIGSVDSIIRDGPDMSIIYKVTSDKVLGFRYAKYFYTTEFHLIKSDKFCIYGSEVSRLRGLGQAKGSERGGRLDRMYAFCFCQKH